VQVKPPVVPLELMEAKLGLKGRKIIMLETTTFGRQNRSEKRPPIHYRNHLRENAIGYRIRHEGKESKNTQVSS